MKRTLLFLCLALFSSFARAEEVSTPPPAPEAPRFSLMGEVLGYGPSASLTQGVAAGWYITPSDLLSFEFTIGSGITFDDLTSGHADTRSYAIVYRRFLTRSLYLKGGALYRTIDWSDVKTDEGYTGSVVRSLSGNSTALEIAIGNRWNIHHFSIGVDWLGYVQPLTTAITSQNDPRGSARDQYLTGATLEICRFSLGVVF